MQISVDPQNLLATKNVFELLFRSAFATVRSEEYNGKKCYYIDNFETENAIVDAHYFDSETGLQVCIMSSGEYSNGTRNVINEFVYEFGTVTDADFIEPDISEYTIISE